MFRIQWLHVENHTIEWRGYFCRNSRDVAKRTDTETPHKGLSNLRVEPFSVRQVSANILAGFGKRLRVLRGVSEKKSIIRIQSSF